MREAIITFPDCESLIKNLNGCKTNLQGRLQQE